MSEEFKEKEIEEVSPAEETPAEAGSQTEEAPVEEVPAEETAEEASAEEVSAEQAPVEEKPKKKRSAVKAFIIGVVAVCLVVAGALGWESIKAGGIKNVFDKNASESSEVKTLNYAKLYKTHKADDVVLTMNGSDFTWDEYFCWLYNMGEQVASYFKQAQMYYGVTLNWDDKVSEDSDSTYFDVVRSGAEGYLKEIITIEKAAAENGVELDAQDEATIAGIITENAASYCGEGATEEDFEKYIADFYMPLDFFKRGIKQDILQDKLFNELYGEDCSAITDAEALTYLEENGYMYASHILFMNTDADGNALDEAAMAEKLEQAKAVVEELRAISGNAKLVQRFKELKEELCEDTGKTMYPDGYMFTSGQFVPSFEETYLNLDDYEVSDPVESDYGYHVIIRLPLDPNAALQYDSNTYEPITAKMQAANQRFGELLQAIYDGITVEYKPGFENIKLEKYLTKAAQ